MTHRELVKKTREAGVHQCKGAYWKIDGKPVSFLKKHVEHVTECCEVGMLLRGFYLGLITDAEQEQMLNDMNLLTYASVERLNDDNDYSWDDFSNLIERNQKENESCPTQSISS